MLLASFFLMLFGVFNIMGIRENSLTTQIIYFIIGFFAYFVVKKIGRHFFSKNSLFFYWLFIGILILTFIIGIEVKGSRRWIDLYVFKFQASEFFKIFFILFFSDFFSKITRFSASFLNFLKAILYFLLPTIIIFLQPDLGNAVVYCFIFIIMLIFSSFPKKYIAYLSGLFVLIMPFFWMILREYQRHRILSFFNSNSEQQSTAYNMIQSVITVGSGNFFGKGLGLGTQSRLAFLPENYTDFAFASLIEQFGFIGGFLVLTCYFMLIIFLFKKLSYLFNQHNRDGLRRFYYVLGFVSFLFFQIIVNVGMNLGIMPIAGIALPFISYGGSAVVAVMIGLALIP